MAQFYSQQPSYNPQNLQFYPSSYPAQPVSGHTTPSQAQYGGASGGYGSTSHGGSSYPGSGSAAFGVGGGGAGFGTGGVGYGGGGGGGGGVGGVGGVSGRMGEQGGLRTGWLAAFGTEGYDGEPPLLEELGVNFEHIKSKTLTVLNPLARIDQHIMDDSDLAGPTLFFLLFGTFLLFSGKVHFGYIYGLALIGSLSLHTIFSLMSPPPPALSNDSSSSSSMHHHHHHDMSLPQMHHDHRQQSSVLASSLTFPRSASVLGYCLLPLVFTSLVGIVAPMDSAGGYVVSCAAIVWCTYSSSGMFCAVGRMRSMRSLVAYPLGLFYVGFGIMVIFSSKRAGPASKG